MNANRDDKRLPRSMRIHLRREKARLRRLLPPDEARRAVAQLIRRAHRDDA